MKFSKKLICILGMSLMLTSSVFGYNQINVIDDSTGVKLQMPNFIERTTYRGAWHIDEYINEGGVPADEISNLDVFKIQMPSDRKIAKVLIDLNKYPTAHTVYATPFTGTYNKELDMIDLAGQSGEQFAPIQKDEKGQGYVYLDLPIRYFINKDQEDNLCVLNFDILDKDGKTLFRVYEINILVDKTLGSETLTNKPKDIDLVIDGYPQEEAPPVQKNGSILVPLKVASKALFAKINYDPKTQQIDISKDSSKIQLHIGSTKASINGKDSLLSTAPEIINGITYVPIRFIGEVFNCNVDWDPVKKVVVVDSKE